MRRSTDRSTLAQRDDAAHAIAARVVAWRREDGGRAALERLAADLPALADRYTDASRRHDSYSVDALATADTATLLERLKDASSDTHRARVEQAALRRLALPAERVRAGGGGPVFLRAVGDSLMGSTDGRAHHVNLRDALAAPRAKFEPFVGPELPPGGDYQRCWCGPHLELACPTARPCDAGCGRRTKDGYCLFCRNRGWVAAAWACAGDA